MAFPAPLICQYYNATNGALRPWVLFDGALRKAVRDLNCKQDKVFRGVLVTCIAQTLIAERRPIDEDLPIPLSRKYFASRGMHQETVVATLFALIIPSFLSPWHQNA